ncbi:MAG: ASKHA domain-containing protein [Desulfuromonadaceae bacterium]
MPILTVKLRQGEQRRIPFSAGSSLRDVLDATEVRVRSGCRGMGTCGLCRVRIEVGNVDLPSFNERLLLDSDELEQGIRLACQVRPEQDLRILLLAPAPKSHWRSFPEKPEQTRGCDPVLPPVELAGHGATPYGVAVDLGTTHIRLSLFELVGGKWLAGRYGLNPQVRYGSDVMTRLVAAAESPVQAQDMSRQIVDAIGEALFDLAVREGIDIRQVVRLALVGNTAMLALLSSRNYQLLLHPKHWVSCVDCLPEKAGDWAGRMGIHPEASIELLPPLAGFVGSDLLAGLLATGLVESGAGSLFIDFGTNSEMALWDGREFWVTSAAGGPAFEECGISCGVPAEPGAIYRVRLDRGVFAYDVISDTEPHGLCGSALVDLIACLVRSGQLSGMGRFISPAPAEGFLLARGKRNIFLSKRDVDMFQRAKAAIGAGIQVLLGQAGMETEGLRRICVGGAFGRFLDIANAQEIGLLPEIPAERIELCGNTALAGCAEVLLFKTAVGRLQALGTRARLINLSRCPDFEGYFLENLFLRPIGKQG